MTTYCDALKSLRINIIPCIYFRATFSPIFTSGKMRGMYKFIKEVANRLTEELGDKADADVDFELKVFLLQFNYTK